jgi:hypothetical protein
MINANNGMKALKDIGDPSLKYVAQHIVYLTEVNGLGRRVANRNALAYPSTEQDRLEADTGVTGKEAGCTEHRWAG